MDGYDVSQHVVFKLRDAVPREAPDEGDVLLDRGLGSCLLRDPKAAAIVAQTLLHHDEERYLLHAWCVMPNHVHALLALNEHYELGTIVRSWKIFTANRINAELSRTGPLWAADYFDRFMRDEDHFQTTKLYIEANPVAAGLCAKSGDWPYSSAGWKTG